MSERIVQVDVQPNPYPVVIGPGVLAQVGPRLAERVKGRRALAITDSNVGPLYGQTVLDSLRSAGFEATLLTLPAGEGTKSLESLARVYDACAEAKIDRTSPLVSIGGGVIGDLTGFAAATWVRGVPFAQCSTTVEADVDASVGGKTAVNHASGKNMIGAFYQPQFVLIDINTLETLSARDYIAGLAESVKHAIIRDADFFAFHESNLDAIRSRDPALLPALLERNVQIKADVVARDERETTGLRALLNFGHTIGHAVESLMARMDLPWRHGEAVAVGMAAAAEMSVAAGRLDRADAERIIALLERIDLPVCAPLAEARADIHKLMQLDKKVAAGKLRFVLADRIGQATLYDDIQPAWIDAGLDRVLC
ncbi:MAG TPA: 3-dehydroquinate synthase [Phycisphaerae bacterium]|nr:3-dehydroquinate synthase [Phycisphaerae bacterium]HOJ75975.1 3-dehydroquinate synthase [Phycisphaerae bacterium]HOM53392.1 3-dehydroquinate synthase [Phycisphaerae bacterium]HON67326.1 3-dehydroquinate synthase [Phycisphaerae bacterium]HOQ86849.1 3-dehydroquinate synthase [Phycisphaerae bacterium]